MKFITGPEEINSNGGFSFVKRLLEGNPHMRLWFSRLKARFNSFYSTSSVVRSAVALMTAGECDFASIEKFRNDYLFKKAVGAPIPSQETFRQRLGTLAEEDWQPVLDRCVAYQLARAGLTRLDIAGLSLIPVDIDRSVFEDTASAKEGIAMSCHKVKVFVPIFCCAGREGYMVASELCPGSQHSENGAVGFLERCLRIMDMAGYKRGALLVRVVSGHDASDFLKVPVSAGVHCLVKRNPRKESPEQPVDSIRSYEEPEYPRRGKVIYRGIRTDLHPADCPEFHGFMDAEATERTILAGGQELSSLNSPSTAGGQVSPSASGSACQSTTTTARASNSTAS